MNEEELRLLVRQVIARTGASQADQPGLEAVSQFHPSHRRYPLPSGASTDGPCLIEPSVMCDHCGYCVSYGH